MEENVTGKEKRETNLEKLLRNSLKRVCSVRRQSEVVAGLNSERKELES